jgi:ubiquitin-protein ligase
VCGLAQETVLKHADVTGPFAVMEFEYPRNSMQARYPPDRNTRPAFRKICYRAGVKRSSVPIERCERVCPIVLQGSFDFKALETRLGTIKELINEEIREWVRLGEVASAKGPSSYDCQQVNIALQKFKRVDPPGISASPQENNSFAWDVTIIGGLEGGWWENGIYTLKLIFPQEFPDVHPRPRFETKMFHPQISEDGFPFLSVSVAESKNVATLLSDVHALLKQPPNPDPRTWLNKEAADLYFNDGEKGREEYARRVRRCAQRSMEE